MFFLGVNFYGHNTSCALIKNGKLIYASEEERFTRIKNDGSIPVNAIKDCLRFAKISLKDISVIYASTVPERLLKEKYLNYTIKNFPKANPIFFEKKTFKIMEFLNNAEKEIRSKIKFKGKIKFINHHLCHVASSHYLSGNTSSCAVSIDGLGEIESSTIYGIKNNNFKLLKKIDYPDSLGMFYSAITYFLGFRPNSSEGTVMALASFGNYNSIIPGKNKTYYDIFKTIIKKSKKNIFEINLEWFNFPYSRVGWVSQKFINFFGKPRLPDSQITQHYKNIASAAQKIFEDYYIKILNEAYKISKNKNLTLSGGCALNCKANGLIYNKTKFNKVYIQPTAHDGGLSIGAAYIGFINSLKKKTKKNITYNHTYFGPNFSNKNIKKILKKNNIEFEYVLDFTKKCAEDLFNKKICGLFQDRMEFGPRALGNRSILSAPYPISKKKIINSIIKHRESFRPFAPSILEGFYEKYYEKNHNSPFMLIATFLKKNKFKDKNKIIATLHNDYSARVQSVSKLTNKNYFKIIENFYKLSGVPVVLNTSFNDKGEPVVCNPLDALKSFFKTNLDVLYLQNFRILRSKNNIRNIKKIL